MPADAERHSSSRHARDEADSGRERREKDERRSHRDRDEHERSSRRHDERDRDRERERGDKSSRSERRDREDREGRRERERRREKDERRDKEERREKKERRSGEHSGSSRRRSRSPHREHGSSKRRDRRDDDRPRRDGGVIDDDEREPDPSREMDFSMQDPASTIPTSASLSLSGPMTASRLASDALPLPHDAPTATSRSEAGPELEPPPPRLDPLTGAPIGEGDMFASLGRERERKPREEKPDPEKLHVSKRELNEQLVQGKALDEYKTETKAAVAPGSAGYQWRMMKLRRVYEAAEEEGRDVEEVAKERYATLADFNEARAERQFLDDRAGGRGGGNSSSGPSSGRNTPSASARPKGFMFSSPAGEGISRPSSRASFRKPGESSAPGTPAAAPTPAARRFQQNGYDTPGSKPGTPVPSVFTPTVPRRAVQSGESAGPTDATRQAAEHASSSAETSGPALDTSALNRLQAKVMRAELTGAPNAAALREELERERAKASGGDRGLGAMDGEGHVRSTDQGADVQVLPTLDGRGRLYDVGTGRPGEDAPGITTGNRLREKNNPDRQKFETHDPKTGELLRVNADDDSVTLAELVRQERFGAGSADQKSMDAELAGRIMNDARYDHNLDYMDENAERLARKKMKTDAMKRQFAIQDFAKTKKALDTCRFCWQDEGAQPPRAASVSTGTRAYLALPEGAPLVEGHCLIVPLQHHLSSLEADDDTWDEIKNFMKCLMQLAHKLGQAYVFYETVATLKHQKHTYIECMPVPQDVHPVLPGTFRQEILSVETEWSQNRKLIDFSNARPFRRAMVPQLPYFMVQWDYKGEKGYGHVIEEGDNNMDADGDDYGMNEGQRSGGAFPKWFAAEIIGTLLDLEPRQWRKPGRLDPRQQTAAVAAFKKRGWDALDWTKMLSQQTQQSSGAGPSGSG